MLLIICWPLALTPILSVHLLINSVEMADRKIQAENHVLEALSIYDKAIAYYPAYPRALLRKAQLKCQGRTREEKEEARKMLLRVIDLSNKDTAFVQFGEEAESELRSLHLRLSQDEDRKKLDTLETLLGISKKQNSSYRDTDTGSDIAKARKHKKSRKRRHRYSDDSDDYSSDSYYSSSDSSNADRQYESRRSKHSTSRDRSRSRRSRSKISRKRKEDKKKSRHRSSSRYDYSSSSSLSSSSSSMSDSDDYDRHKRRRSLRRRRSSAERIRSSGRKRDRKSYSRRRSVD